VYIQGTPHHSSWRPGIIDELVSDDEEDEVHPPAENPLLLLNLQVRREREINSPWITP